MDKLDITPTQDGVRNMVALFTESIARAEAKIAEAEGILHHETLSSADFMTPELFEEGLEAIITLEQERIARLREGIEAATPSQAAGGSK
jgi:hypothetical protein